MTAVVLLQCVDRCVLGIFAGWRSREAAVCVSAAVSMGVVDRALRAVGRIADRGERAASWAIFRRVVTV